MARIYVSSTKADLENERAAVLAWIAQRHDQPVHSYVADTDTVRDSCVADVAGCDVYVLLIASRYGTVAAGDNPAARSITELEYEAALARPGMRIVVILVDYVTDPRLTDLRNRSAYNKLLDFRDRVTAAHRPAQINSLAELIPALEAALNAAAPRDPMSDPEVQGIIVRLTRQAHEKDERIEALMRENQQLRERLADGVARTLAAGDAPGADAARSAAAAALRQGDTGPAQALMRQDAMVSEAAAASASTPQAEQSARRDAARLARERGALAMQVDVTTALAAFLDATRNEPTDVLSWFLLGDMALLNGELATADSSYQSGLRAAERRTADDDSDAAWRDLSVCHERIGSVRVAQGDLAAALRAYEASLEIAERLVARDPSNPASLRELSVVHDRIGDLHIALGEPDPALRVFRTSLAIRERLARNDPDNSRLQRDLSISHIRIGDALIAQGHRADALQSFEADLAIARRLAEKDPANMQWQRDLSVSHDRTGEIRVAQEDLTGALQAFEAGLAIRERLVARDPANTEWQRDLSVSHEKRGDVLVARKDPAAAMKAFAASLAIREHLAARDPANTQWQLDLAASCAKMGAADAAPQAVRGAHLRRGLQILDDLAAAGRLPPNQDWRDWFREHLGPGGPPPAA